MATERIVSVDVRPSFIAVAVLEPRRQQNHVLRVGAVHRTTQRPEEIIAAIREFNRDEKGSVLAQYAAAALSPAQCTTDQLVVPPKLPAADFARAIAYKAKHMPKPSSPKRVVRSWNLGKHRFAVSPADAGATAAIQRDYANAYGLTALSVHHPGIAWLSTFDDLDAIYDDAGPVPYIAFINAQGFVELQTQPEHLAPDNAGAAFRATISGIEQSHTSIQRVAFFGNINTPRYQKLNAAATDRGVELYPFETNGKICPPWAFALATAAQGVAWA